MVDPYLLDIGNYREKRAVVLTLLGNEIDVPTRDTHGCRCVMHRTGPIICIDITFMFAITHPLRTRRDHRDHVTRPTKRIRELLTTR
ncbi:unnamed protein product [Toxocara canis]|uniref:Uncharacterized protein n=1 Tax=Toxocara canis TaxID=6265 RepID=A0A183VCA6_TOXCA|nr:unnamed protein product [Toxocara canis]